MITQSTFLERRVRDYLMVKLTLSYTRYALAALAAIGFGIAIN